MSKDTPRLPNFVQLQLGSEEFKDLVDKARDWALMHGAAMRSKKDFNEDTLYVAPFALLPSVVPRKEYQNVIEIQTVFNELIHKIAHHDKFLSNCLKVVTEVDDFTAHLFEIYETVRREGICQVSGILEYIFKTSLATCKHVLTCLKFQFLYC